jgi:hypothetical protein
MTTTTLTRALAGGALALAAVSLSGCSLITGMLSGEDDVFTLKAGDCINDYGDEEQVATVPTVDCSTPHDYEVYSVATIDGEDYPGSTEVDAKADTLCLDAFEGFVGMSFEDSIYYYTYLTPSGDSWATGDREVVCTIADYDEDAEAIIQVTGSLEGIEQ